MPTIEISGLYVQCHVCRAALVMPVPSGWTLEITRAMLTEQIVITPHLPHCGTESRTTVVVA